jgi:actin, other eukaryote
MSSISKRLEKMEIFFDQEEFVVVDIGTGYIKAGFSGEDLPRCIIPTVMGERTIDVEAQQLAAGGTAVASDLKPKISHVFGNSAFAAHDHELSYPVQRGIITDTTHMQTLLEHIFEHELGLQTKDMNVLITDSPMNTKENKMEICKMMFETFKVQRFTLVNTATLSLFSTGTTTGLVAESGEGTTYAVPVFEGYALPHAILKLNVAGQDVTQKLIDEFIAAKAPVEQKHFQKVREMKETMCHVSQNYREEVRSRDDPLNQEQRSYELPGGDIVEVNLQKRITAAEIIFNPSLAGLNEDGFASIAYRSIEMCDEDLRTNLYGNIVLAGGTSLMSGFTERFE